MQGCIFCSIASGLIPATIVYQDEDVVAFRDIHPVAPFHVLVIPRVHLASLAESTEADAALLGRLMLAARRVAHDAGFQARGYRTIVNTGADAGQSVHHLHVHVLAGKTLSWP
jgi:histidine triad (HIT) family protein